MSIFEYDKERELKLIRRAEYEEGLKEGHEAGLEQGRITTLKKLISKKLSKGWSAAQTVEDLELECSEVEKLEKEIADS